MADLDPTIAQKVLAADIRNKVKKVGDGGTLNAAERQIFLSMTEGDSSPEELREARISALLRKWMDGGRLSLSERDEIAHMLPEAAAVITEATPLPQRSGALSETDVLEAYQISRAKYFRWKQAGQAVTAGPDMPPFDEPKQMVLWYERMRERGVFKHQCPKRLKDLAAKGFPQKEGTMAAPRSAPPGEAKAQRLAPERRGFIVEYEELEIHVAQLREDYKAAYASDDPDKGQMLKTRYFEAYALLNKSAKEKNDICLAEGSIAKKSDIEEDLGSIVPSIVARLISRQHLRSIYDELGIEALGMAFEVFMAVQKRQMLAGFEALVKSKFAPPFDLT